MKSPRRARSSALFVALGLTALAVLLALGTWQVRRLAWKEDLLSSIESRIASDPVPLARIEAMASAGEDVDYRPTIVEGRFVHEGERHMLATHQGMSGWYVYTPLELADGRYLLVNRGFVTYHFKNREYRPVGLVQGEVTVVGLARSRLEGKPSFMVPDNDPAQNVFYWKDLSAMAATSGVGTADDYLPFFVDADDTRNPGGLPIGGVTIVSLPNNHLQYAVTWYGLAAVLVVVMAVWLIRGRKA
ncbi:MAG: SURF1 family protein [Rhizobiaceae bacterium]|nr:SURF1 family protein [Rhizobiaceae bacterium]MCV0405651.1 SURF1 family protein [Rhizobiaceae bacterium]